jgi:hypothetical protein
MTSLDARFARLPYTDRVALFECVLRGAARHYAEECNSPGEDDAAGELRDAAVGYVRALASGASAKKGPRARKERP